MKSAILFLMTVTNTNKMSLHENEERLETIRDEVQADIMMYFALKGLAIDTDEFYLYTLQDMCDKLTIKQFRDEAR